MSTRTQIRIISNGFHVDLYHHCDGYFEGVGEQLKLALAKNKDPFGFIEALTVEDSSYELTNTFHGDIEFFYEINFDSQSFKGYEISGFPVWPNMSFDCLHIKPNCIRATMDLITGKIF